MKYPLLSAWLPLSVRTALGGKLGVIAAGMMLGFLAGAGRQALAAERAPQRQVRVASRFTQPAAPPLPETASRNDRLKPIGEIALPAGLPAKRPEPNFAANRFGQELPEVQGMGASRLWATSVYAWEAPAFCHRPLYFEDENLERYGHSFGAVQPAVSAAHFFSRATVLPYLAGAFPPHDCVYTLGKGRPGSCMPYYLYRPPVSARGAVYQAGAVTGLSFIVP
jgi:hypothetical protein